jgi:chemotaxis protein MotB
MSEWSPSRGTGYEDLFSGHATEEDNWLISYVDLLTNLLAFFVLLFAISVVHSYRFELLSKAFSANKRVGVTELKRRMDELIATESLHADLETTADENGLAIQLKNNFMFFSSGSAELSPAGDRLLAALGGMLMALEYHYEVVVEGHTDAVPIHTAEFESNWELSAKRSVNVVKRLVEIGVARDVISAQAFAETRPARRSTDADQAESRAQDRRVVVRVR